MPPIGSELVLPSLLDRLTDFGGLVDAGIYRSPDQYLVTVRRDLLWLLKTDAAAAADVILDDDSDADGTSVADQPIPVAVLADYREAATSVVAFGVPMARGQIEKNSSGLELAKAIERAIRAFEPRLDPGTLRVRVNPVDPAREADDSEASLSVINIQIQGRVRIKSISRNLVLQAFYTPALAQWRIEEVANGS